MLNLIIIVTGILFVLVAMLAIYLSYYWDSYIRRIEQNPYFEEEEQ